MTSYSQSLTGQTRLVLVDFVNNLLINFTMFSPLDVGLSKKTDNMRKIRSSVLSI
jgi:hypothetical protein